MDLKTRIERLEQRTGNALPLPNLYLWDREDENGEPVPVFLADMSFENGGPGEPICLNGFRER